MDIFGETFILKIADSYLDAYTLGAENGNHETYHDATLKQSFKDQFGKLCMLEQSMKDELNLINNFNSTSVENFDKEYKQALKDMKKNTPKLLDIERFVKFSNDIDKIAILNSNDEIESQLQANNSIQDEDIQMKESQLIEIDPLSKRPIRDPVRNVLCQHIYDRDSIMNAIKMNSKTKCAYLGCINKQPVLASHLKDDPIFKAKLDQIYTQRENNAQEGFENLEN
ncbi:hypothetical protein PVAND_010340 [Polypedilum vanderplanki]|uniref:E3 SUMO-protein ligase NSE2 n=1 Tax=Polypedilum vanderplanki TaxID=319348 RepID=A0A9J6CGD7_POLVA|nr:hypothetical protein PVAND_010340 [Polypedilum vanderplanki]